MRIIVIIDGHTLSCITLELVHRYVI